MNPEVYQRNLQALELSHPELKPDPNVSSANERIVIHKAKSGAYRLIVTSSSGEKIWIHNENDPVQVAQNTARKILSEGKRVFVLMGMGLGYLARELTKNLESGSALIIYEADLEIFHLALQLVDLTSVFKHKHVKILAGKDARLEAWCYRFMLDTGAPVNVIRYEPALLLAPDLYFQKIHKELVRFTTGALINWVTANRFGPIFTKSILEAVPHIIDAVGVNKLQNLFSGVPAVIVAAGPSLEKNCHLLQKIKGRAVIIAADTVIGYLLARGIKPDFVLSVDPQDDTILKYEGVSIPKDVALVFHPSCNDWIPKHFPGPKFVTESSMVAYQWLKEFWPSKGSIEWEMQCQVHMGFNLAQLMGCDPIMLLGLDLCYTDNLVHVKGGTYFHEGTQDGWIQDKGQIAKNIFGEPVKADPVFFGYRNTWENKIKNHTGKVINVTEGGVGIEGAENMLFSDAIDQYCQHELLDIPDLLLSVESGVEEANLNGLFSEVEDRIRDLFRLERASQRIFQLLEKLEQLRKSDDIGSFTLDRVSHKAEKLTRYIPRYAKTLGLLQLIDFELELFMCRESTGEADIIEDDIERLDQQIIRGKRYYGDLLKAIPQLKKLLLQLQDRLKVLRELENADNSFDTPEKLLSLARKLASIGCFNKSAKIFLEHVDILNLAAYDEAVISLGIEICLGQCKLQLARKFAQEGNRRWPNSKDMHLLFQAVRKNWARWEKRQNDVKYLKICPQKSVFYSGDFYFRIGNLSFAERHYRQVAENIECDKALRGEAFYRLFKIWQNKEDREQALWALEQALCMSPADPRIFFELGVLALKVNQIDDASRFFLKGVEISLEDPEFCEAVAAVFCAAGLPNHAIPFYEIILRHSPENQEILKKISEAYQTIFENVPTA